MFDDIQSEYPLPDVGIVPLDKQKFQSKSLLCLMCMYTITSEGRLLCGFHDTEYHGDVLFYGEIEIDGEQYSKRYVARFNDGQLVRITYVDDVSNSWG